MIYGEKLLASEPHFSAYLYVLQRAILYLRARAGSHIRISPLQLENLLDAIHNIPQFVRQNTGWFVEQNIREELARYDRRWGKIDDGDGGFRWLEELDYALRTLTESGSHPTPDDPGSKENPTGSM